MMLKIANVLNRDQLETVRRSLSEATFVDGTVSAGAQASTVKRNEQAEENTEAFNNLNQMVIGSLCRHPSFRSGALPFRVARAHFARYRPGMSYGDHIDDPLMGENQGNRSDIAVTIFLSDDDAYDGGELVIRTSFGEHEVKLPAGDAVMYPASSLHRVREVTRGERLVAVSWVQSLVRDPVKRELLYELDMARQSLMRATPKAEVTEMVEHVYANLLRMWAEV